MSCKDTKKNNIFCKYYFFCKKNIKVLFLLGVNHFTQQQKATVQRLFYFSKKQKKQKKQGKNSNN